MALFRSLSVTDQALGLGLSLSAILLAGAHIFERAGYPPCELCLDQREAHWAAAAVAAAGLVFSRLLKARIAAVAAVGALAVVYAVSVGLAAYHTGVEFRFWPGPATCTAAAPIEVNPDGLGGAFERGPTGPSCADAMWRFIGVSMAGYNLLFSLAMMAFCLYAALRESRAARAARLGDRVAPQTGSPAP